MKTEAILTILKIILLPAFAVLGFVLQSVAAAEIPTALTALFIAAFAVAALWKTETRGILSTMKIAALTGCIAVSSSFVAPQSAMAHEKCSFYKENESTQEATRGWPVFNFKCDGESWFNNAPVRVVIANAKMITVYDMWKNRARVVGIVELGERAGERTGLMVVTMDGDSSFHNLHDAILSFRDAAIEIRGDIKYITTRFNFPKFPTW